MSQITPKQARAIEALLTCPTIGQAAEQANVNRRTLERWLNTPGFRAALTEAEGGALDLVTRRLVAMADKALTALESVLSDPEQPAANVKRLAALGVLDQLIKMHEFRNFETRLSALEEAQFGKHK